MCRVFRRTLAEPGVSRANTLGLVCRKPDLFSAIKPASTVAVANLIMASPAFAEGKLFDFNLTLPVMAGQFLLLMVFLDKTWFTPVGKVLDERDELIRSKLASVQGDSGKIAEMQAEAERVLKEARDAATAAVNEAKATTQAEQDAKIEVLRAVRRFSLTRAHAVSTRAHGTGDLYGRVSVPGHMFMAVCVQQLDKELSSAMAELEKERSNASASISEQVRQLVSEMFCGYSTHFLDTYMLILSSPQLMQMRQPLVASSPLVHQFRWMPWLRRSWAVCSLTSQCPRLRPPHKQDTWSF
jgi:F0F1-type ATP synthase membrane subunit b/b'